MSARRPPGLPALVLNNNSGSGNSGNSGGASGGGGASGAVTGPLPFTPKVVASSTLGGLSLTSDNFIHKASASKGAAEGASSVTPTPATARRWTAARTKLHSDANTDRCVKEGRPANRS